MKLTELISGLKWPEVEKELTLADPDAADFSDSYQTVFTRLKSLDPAESNMRIVIRETFHEEFDDAPQTEVTGRNGTLNRELNDFQYLREKTDERYANAETDFSLAFTPWNEWLGMPVDPQTLASYSHTQIAVLSLLEMTFHGFNEAEIKSESDELKRRIDELESMTDEERDQHLIPWEEVKKELNRKFKR